ncbi:glycosyltransferase [Mesorhizobium xinjiangense]|uniref:glycosyltransferase n=1 Tax=Mesorhizobium xinjiangense TaxID=2678685 RepID=UPI0012EE54F9|nr:glycosyltransferase [Mesorhizobium xinjiangense]
MSGPVAGGQAAADHVVVVLKGYPRLSETFIAQEIHALEQAGFRLSLVSLRHPTSKKRHPVHDEIKAPVTYLPEYLYQEPLRVLKAWLKARRLPGYAKAWRHWLADLKRDFTPNRGRRFGQALVLAAEFPADATWIYSHFIHTPSSVARYAGDMLGAPWSASAHAKDIWTSPDWELSEKMASARWVVTCTAGGCDHLKALAADPSRVSLVYHGLDLDRFGHAERTPGARDGSAPGEPVRLLSVGRAVHKKGFDTLLEALARLPGDLSWRWTHIGGGDLEDELKAQAERVGLAGKVVFAGGAAQQQVLEAYRASDLFVLPCRISGNGDRDGLPNVLVEAQSQGLMCISTDISGIPELIRDGENGILIEPERPDQLAAAMERAVRDPELRSRQGAAGEHRVRSDFDHHATIGALIDLFERSGVRHVGSSDRGDMPKAAAQR